MRDGVACELYLLYTNNTKHGKIRWLGCPLLAFPCFLVLESRVRLALLFGFASPSYFFPLHQHLPSLPFLFSSSLLAFFSLVSPSHIFYIFSYIFFLLVPLSQTPLLTPHPQPSPKPNAFRHLLHKALYSRLNPLPRLKRLCSSQGNSCRSLSLFRGWHSFLHQRCCLPGARYSFFFHLPVTWRLASNSQFPL